jgi:ABC-2 type transport system permease protein
MVFTAFFHASNHLQPMRMDQTITYIWLGQALFALLPWQVDTDVRDMIRSGTVAYEMARPVDLYIFWFMRAFAARTAPVLMRAIPMLVLAYLLLGLKPPPSWIYMAAWCVAVFGAAILASAITTLMTISLLWTTSGEGITRLVPIFAYTFGGLLIPLAFFPTWSQPILSGMPFKYLLDTPFRIYLGTAPISQWPAAALREIAWIASLMLMGRYALARGLSRLALQGG